MNTQISDIEAEWLRKLEEITGITYTLEHQLQILQCMRGE